MSGTNDNNIDSVKEMDPVEENHEKLVSSIKEENPKSLSENNGSIEMGKMDPGLESKSKASAEITLVASEMNLKDLSIVKIIQEGSKLEENGAENGNKMEKNVKLGNIKEVDYEENDKIEETPSNGKGKDVENGGNGEDADEEEEDDFDLFLEGDDDGTEEEQAAFMRELETFHREMRLEYKPPKFYGVGLNCLKLWRAVIRLGGYERVTACKLWRQVGESFNPPKTCTTISWSFRSFYEKALLEYEKHKILTGKLRLPVPSLQKPIAVEFGSPASGPGRARRDAAERAMQGWHSQKLLNNSDGDPIIRRDKYQKGIGTIKRKKTSGLDSVMKGSQKKPLKPQVEAMVVDVGEPADWVKISVKKTKDCFEVYALVPGLLRDEVHVQSDPAGHLIISGEPDQPDNPWGVTPFKKVITLPSRVDPHQTSAVVTLHGQLFVRAPFEQSDP